MSLLISTFSILNFYIVTFLHCYIFHIFPFSLMTNDLNDHNDHITIS